jgi:SAM-dependent methyltransferase
MQPTPVPDALVPSPWVRRFLPLIPAGGQVLDVAAGQGRHTRLLRANGYEVVAVDRDAAALHAAFAGDAGTSIIEADLEDGRAWHLGQGYAGIIVANYLHRPLFPALAASLAPGGALICETFMAGNERFGRPANPDFLLRPGELLAAFSDRLIIVAFEQGGVAAPRPAVIQRIAAVNGAAGPLPPG